MPATHPTSVTQYAGLIVKSRLMPPEEVHAVQTRWQQGGKSDSDVEGFRKSLVSSRLLTEYQAALLNRGHTEGYFLGEYTIVDMIGKGRMAGVYKATHRSGQTVAIKVLPPSKAKQGQFLARFLREAKLLCKLNHPNVVRAFEVGESTGRHFFVMEALDGITLDEVLEKRSKLPPVEAIRIIYQALLGLQHLHEKGMIHRDLKPANLMLSPTPGSKEDTLRSTVKILDIGLGRMVFDDSDVKEDPATQLTGENVLLGTPDYLAPEQARNARDVDIRADLYSLGCTLYHCLTGQPPFPDTTVMTQVLRHATENARPLSDFIPNVPNKLQEVLNFLMAKQPGQRYPNPLKAAQALEPLLQSIPDAASPASTSPVKPGYEKWLAAQHGTEGTQNEPELQTLEAISPIVMPTRRPFTEAQQPSPGTSKERPALPRKERSDPTGPPPIRPPLPIIETSEYDVVAVELDEPPPPPRPRRRPRDEGEPRGLLELDRRDFLMLGVGAGGVLLAILTGYTLAQSLRRKDPPKDDEKKETDTKPESDSKKETESDNKKEVEPKKDDKDKKKSTGKKKDTSEKKEDKQEMKQDSEK